MSCSILVAAGAINDAANNIPAYFGRLPGQAAQRAANNGNASAGDGGNGSGGPGSGDGGGPPNGPSQDGPDFYPDGLGNNSSTANNLDFESAG